MSMADATFSKAVCEYWIILECFKNVSTPKAEA
jgi:hypothetical protein